MDLSQVSSSAKARRAERTAGANAAVARDTSGAHDPRADALFDERPFLLRLTALDWLFGVNPWGVSMVIGLPHNGLFARDPHSIVARELGAELTGGLVDGPVYRSIYHNLRAIHLFHADEYAPFNTGFIVYHDDLGDYSTNEPIMDGTANLAYLLSALAR